jgi:hypothetical protein
VRRPRAQQGGFGQRAVGGQRPLTLAELICALVEDRAALERALVVASGGGHRSVRMPPPPPPPCRPPPLDRRPASCPTSARAAGC